MFGEDFISRALIGIPALLLALTVHEFFHAWTALRFGDPTARDMGRLTLNPLAHLDLFGAIVIVISNFTFGWAKPVPVNPSRFDNPRRADLWVAFAGPLSNIGLAIIFGLFYRAIVGMNLALPDGLIVLVDFCVSINVILALFNLIPLHPLDGSHILRSLLPPSMGPSLDQLDRVSPFILIAMLIFGFIWPVIGPVYSYLYPLLRGY